MPSICWKDTAAKYILIKHAHIQVSRKLKHFLCNDWYKELSQLRTFTVMKDINILFCSHTTPNQTQFPIDTVVITDVHVRLNIYYSLKNKIGFFLKCSKIYVGMYRLTYTFITLEALLIKRFCKSVTITLLVTIYVNPSCANFLWKFTWSDLWQLL